MVRRFESYSWRQMIILHCIYTQLHKKYGWVAEWSIAPDCKSGVLVATVVRIHPYPPRWRLSPKAVEGSKSNLIWFIRRRFKSYSLQFICRGCDRLVTLCLESRYTWKRGGSTPHHGANSKYALLAKLVKALVCKTSIIGSIPIQSSSWWSKSAFNSTIFLNTHWMKR